MRDNEVIERIDAFCDVVPRRRARADEHGPLELFVPTGSGWPYYARPKRGSRPPVTAADIRAVRARQRELIIPESFEWIEQTAPEMAAAAAEAGLEVWAHPLMVLAGPAQVPPPPGVTVRIVAPEDAELERVWAVPTVAFSHPGTSVGDAGPAERDKIAADHDGGTLAMLRENGWSAARCVPHGGHQMSLNIAAGLGLGGNESYPDLFQPYGGFPDGVRVENGFVTMPDLVGIGFEGKADLYREMKALSD